LAAKRPAPQLVDDDASPDPVPGSGATRVEASCLGISVGVADAPGATASPPMIRHDDATAILPTMRFISPPERDELMPTTLLLGGDRSHQGFP